MMREADLRAISVCACCGEKILAHAGIAPTFYSVTVTHYAFDVAAARRQDGLAAFIGSTRIASIMGPDEPMAQPVSPPTTVGVCASCVIANDALCAIVAVRRPIR